MLLYNKPMLCYISMAISKGMAATHTKNVPIAMVINSAFPMWVCAASNAFEMVVMNESHGLPLTNTATSKCPSSDRRRLPTPTLAELCHALIIPSPTPGS